MMKRLYPAGLLTMGARIRRTVALVATITLLGQNFASATCSNGQSLPAGGFVVGRDAVVANASNWSPGVFTGPTESIFIPDNSVFEHNNPAEPLTGGGHNWVFDQGFGLCKAIDTGPPGGTPTGWQISQDCIVLPVVISNIITEPKDIPYQGQAITPTCNPALLSQPGAPNPTNTRLNQLGCAISHGVATTPQSAATFLFVAGSHLGLFGVPLVNVPNPVSGGDAGKTVDPSFSFVAGLYSDIPAGKNLTNAAVSPDGMFALATSIRRSQPVYACLNPLGDPGDPGQPIDPNFAIPSASQVKCMVIGNNGLQVDLTTAFGPDNQPYFGGQRTVTTFNADPGGSSPSAWPQCTFNFAFPPNSTLSFMDKLKTVFNAHSQGHCGTAVPNVGFSGLPGIQPGALISHGSYMYSGGTAQPAVQFKVTVDPVTGLSQYARRTYDSGGSGFTTGLGVADDLNSFVAFTDPSGLGLAGQEVIYKMPLCEDM